MDSDDLKVSISYKDLSSLIDAAKQVSLYVAEVEALRREVAGLSELVGSQRLALCSYTEEVETRLAELSRFLPDYTDPFSSFVSKCDFISLKHHLKDCS